MGEPVRQALVAVIGGATCSHQEADWAHQVGRLLAERGVGIVCGGRGGVMAAVCRGAVEAGGMSVGILPGESTAEANPWVRIALPTGLGEARNALVVRCGLGVIAIGGGYGTLSEIALALKAGKRVAGLGTWDIDGVRHVETPQEAVTYVLGEVESGTLLDGN
ncbi:MAG: TIGR00725 family protein [Caldilineae bacterium]|nr:MAG: TIGR00725 family protein [Caldilineae bacterium]